MKLSGMNWVCCAGTIEKSAIAFIGIHLSWNKLERWTCSDILRHSNMLGKHSPCPRIVNTALCCSHLAAWLYGSCCSLQIVIHPYQQIWICWPRWLLPTPPFSLALPAVFYFTLHGLHPFCTSVLNVNVACLFAYPVLHKLCHLYFLHFSHTL